MTFVRFMCVIWQDFQNTRSNRRQIKGRNNDEISLINAEQLPALFALGHLDLWDGQSGEVLIPEAVQADAGRRRACAARRIWARFLK